MHVPLYLKILQYQYITFALYSDPFLYLQEVIERSCNYLETCLANGTLNPRLRFLTQDTLDLRANGWRLREGNRGPHPPGRNVRG